MRLNLPSFPAMAYRREERPSAPGAGSSRRIPGMCYRLRLILYTYNGIAWPLLMPQVPDDAVFWALWIGLHAVWPHFAYLRSRNSPDALRTERVTLALETALIGCTVNELNYEVWYVFSALASSFISSVAFGGPRLLAGAAGTFLAGTLLWGLARGFQFAGSPPLAVELAGAFGGAIPLLLTTQANFRVLSRLARARREIAERNRRYQAMMELSAGLKNTTDTHVLIIQALHGFRQLMPDYYGFGIVLWDAGSTVIRYAQFNGIDEPMSTRVIETLGVHADSGEEAGGPMALMVDGEPFHVLPLTPHLQQLQGFVVVYGEVGEGELTTMLRLFAEQVASSLESNILTQRLDWLAKTDRLTGLNNRVYLDEQLTNARRNQAGPAGTPYTLVMIDLNGLKAVNDTYGHEAGDAMIRLAANLLRRAGRSADVLTRYGGDEFVILANDCGRRDVARLVARIEAKVHEQHIDPLVAEGEALDLRVSLSIGAASSDEPEIGDLLETADQRMYENKRRIQAGLATQ